jgi:hypothetical protein
VIEITTGIGEEGLAYGSVTTTTTGTGAAVVTVTAITKLVATGTATGTWSYAAPEYVTTIDRVRGGLNRPSDHGRVVEEPPVVPELPDGATCLILSNNVSAASTQFRIDSARSQTTPSLVSPLRRKNRAPPPNPLR